jgi:predicted homoserine dehydrogenase-like protein
MIKRALDRRAEQRDPIKVGFVGRMGKAICQVESRHARYARADETITYDVVDLMKDTTFFHLKTVQDAAVAGTFVRPAENARAGPKRLRRPAS